MGAAYSNQTFSVPTFLFNTATLHCPHCDKETKITPSDIEELAFDGPIEDAQLAAGKSWIRVDT